MVNIFLKILLFEFRSFTAIDFCQRSQGDDHD